MKNQYFGDINDYLKYGMLRIIGRATGLRIAVCWMLTENDSRADGKKIAYLDQPERWRHYDPPLFDTLQAAVRAGRRNIGVAEEEPILPGATYHTDVLDDCRASRSQHFERLAICAAACDLVFFDPDNGMAGKSKSIGRKVSAKFLFWDEAKRVHAQGKSLIVYQHFAKVKREAFIASMRERFSLETDAGWIGALATSMSPISWSRPRRMNRRDD